MIRNDYTPLFRWVNICLINCPRSIVIICIISFIYFGNTLGQEKVSISPPSLKFVNDRLIIQYDIAGYEPSDRFQVWLEITDSTGQRIYARSLYGDIGDEVTGGIMKQIIWDLAADSIYMNLDISVEVFVTRKIKPPPVIAEKIIESPPKTKIDSVVADKKAEKLPDIKIDSVVAEKKTEKTPDIKLDSVVTEKKTEKLPETKIDTVFTTGKTKTVSEIKTNADDNANKEPSADIEEKSTTGKTIKVGSSLVLSAICPGLGQTRLSNGKPYWIIGIAGYGCIAASLYLNKASASNYDKYMDSFDADKIDDYYNTGKNQYTASNVLALSAIVIWVADLGITWIRASNMKRSADKTKSNSFSFRSSFDYNTDTQMMSFIYTF